MILTDLVHAHFLEVVIQVFAPRPMHLLQLGSIFDMTPTNIQASVSSQSFTSVDLTLSSGLSTFLSRGNSVSCLPRVHVAKVHIQFARHLTDCGLGFVSEIRSPEHIVASN